MLPSVGDGLRIARRMQPSAKRATSAPLRSADAQRPGDAPHRKTSALQTLNDMLSRKPLTTTQHREIAEWIAAAKAPEAIMVMPPALWRALPLAILLTNVDADLTQPPLLSP